MTEAEIQDRVRGALKVAAQKIKETSEHIESCFKAFKSGGISRDMYLLALSTYLFDGGKLVTHDMSLLYEQLRPMIEEAEKGKECPF